MSAGEVVSLQAVTFHIAQTGFVRLNHAVDDFCGRYATDAHQKQLDERYTHTADLCIDPQHERHIVEENDDRNAEQYNQNDL